MKAYQRYSTEDLQRMRLEHLHDIEQWEDLSERVNSRLILLSLRAYIKRAHEHIHAIDAELCYREHKDADKESL